MANFEVPFDADAFPGHIQRVGVLKFTSADLAHALFVTGRAPADRWAHGDASTWEWLSRSSMVPAYVREDSGRLMRSALADDLDRSEKAALSYALGQAMTTIFCVQELGVQYLMHVDRYAARWNVQFGQGQSRPDLIGQTHALDWVVAEAKGRSNAMEAALRQKLINQKGMIQSISGQPPALTMGCVASFPPAAPGVRGRMRLDAIDPPPDKEALRLEISDARFLRAYFEPFVSAINFGTRVDTIAGYVIAALGRGLQVGLRSEIYNAMQEGLASPDEDLRSLLIQSDESALRNEIAEFGRSDGTYISTDWDAAHALRDFESVHRSF